MKILKTTFTLLFLAVAMAACAGSTTKKNNQSVVEQKKSVVEQKKGDNKMKVVHLTKEEFLSKVYNFEKNPNDWKYEGDKPAIVDFFATWCGPCKALSPIMEELAEEYDGKLYIYKVDVDQEEDLAAAFGIRSIPTLLFIPQNGKPTITQGMMPKADLKKMIDTNLLK
jgi:thioredoxin